MIKRRNLAKRRNETFQSFFVTFTFVIVELLSIVMLIIEACLVQFHDLCDLVYIRREDPERVNNALLYETALVLD